jgi:hypothetical protein
MEFGVWQIDSCYMPSYQQSCLLDEQCSAMVAYQISSHGLDWTRWPAYRNGTYLRYVPAANSALGRLMTTLRSGSDGTCLEADPGSTGDGAGILHVACSGSDPYQDWRIQEVNGVVLLQNSGDHECLDANGSDGSDGAALYQWDCNPTDDHQHWVLRANDTPDVSAGAALRNVGNETCVSVAGSGQSNHAVQWTCASADPREQWG